MDNFLKEVLGDTGYHALNNAINKAPVFKPMILPRTIASWVNIIGNLGYEGEIPGVSNSYFSLKKNENGYSGALTVNNELVYFNSPNTLQISAAIGSVIGNTPEKIEIQIKPKDLAKIGESIDLLVKTEIIRKARKDSLEKQEGKMPSAPPNPPDKPIQATPPVPPQRSQPNVFGAKKPYQKDNIALGQGQSKLKITKSESEKTCEECGTKHFLKDKFKGCHCIEDIAKSFTTDKTLDGYILLFNKTKVDVDELRSVIYALKS